MGMGGQHHVPVQSPGAYWTRNWVGPRAGLNECGEKSLHPQGLEPQTVQPVASRNTDFAIAAHYSSLYLFLTKATF